jgi:CheY-like chemotaxis protein
MKPSKILVVDDDSDITETIRFRLEKEGYQVTTAADGGDALEQVQQGYPDLIVLDVMMPKENGYRVSKMVKEYQQEGKISKKIPVILLTARNLKSDPDRERMFKEFSQADDVIYKPFEMDDLVHRIQKMLHK